MMTGSVPVAPAGRTTRVLTWPVGPPGTVVPDGTHRALTGKVVAISQTPTATTTTSTLYRVMVGLTGLAAVEGLRGDTSIADRASVGDIIDRCFTAVLNAGLFDVQRCALVVIPVTQELLIRLLGHRRGT